MVEDERRKRKRVGECLARAGSDIYLQNQQLEEALKRNWECRYLWEKTFKGQKVMREGFEI